MLDIMLLYRQTVLPIHGYSKYNTPDASVPDETDFWTVRSYYFWILALMSLTDVLMTLLKLTTRCRGDLDSILIEDVTLLRYDFDWIGYQ